jgi:hypothetical protein
MLFQRMPMTLPTLFWGIDIFDEQALVFIANKYF